MGLDTVELFLSVEKRFEINVPDDVAAELTTVGKLHQFVVTERDRSGKPATNPDIIFDQLRTIICEHLNVKPSAVIPTARFVQDLGAK